MSYNLEGTMLEACSCDAICPCWVGQDPDGGTCQGIVAWHFEKGDVDGIDVAGLTIAVLVDIPGNALAGNWRASAFVSDSATDEQKDAILSVYTGKQGGPVADLAHLIGEVVSVESVPINFGIEQGKGELKIGSVVDAEMAPFEGATGQRTTLSDAVFSVIPGAPAYVGTAPKMKASSSALGINLDLSGQSAVQGQFAFNA